MQRSAEAPLGTPRLHLRLTGSTNDEGRRLAGRGAPHGTLITASEQTSGRGRHGRRWSAPAGSALLMSLVLREWPQLLPLAVPLAVCDVISDEALVKWPNDVVVQEPRNAAPLRKLAGILIEGRPQEGWLVVGIGLNVAVNLKDMPHELQSTAATMGRRAEDVEVVLSDLLGALERRLSEPSEETVSAWRARDALLGAEVSFAGGEGTAEGIDDGGRLIVRGADRSTRALDSGEVVLTDASLKLALARAR